MNMMMFPRMFTSHDEGWVWLMQIHPSVTKMYLRYVVPMSLLPPAMLLYAASAYSGGAMLGNMSLREAWIVARLFFVAELVMVPVMGMVIQRIGAMVNAQPAYHDTFAFAAVAPTPLWLCSLALLVPSLAFNALAMGTALVACGMLIHKGTYRIFELRDEGRSMLLTGTICAAGLVAWVSLMGLAILGSGWILA